MIKLKKISVLDQLVVNIDPFPNVSLGSIVTVLDVAKANEHGLKFEV